MKHLHLLGISLILFAVTCLTACGDDDDKKTSGITNQSWTEGTPLPISIGKTLSVTFNAKEKWQATSNATWCKVLTQTGNSGESTLSLLVSTTTNVARTATIQIIANGYAAAKLLVTQGPESGDAGNVAINTQVDDYLRKMYLWNDEYKTLTLDFMQDYESFFYGALGSMTTNTLDKRKVADNRYTLFSYIEEREAVTRGTKLIDKELQYSFGITGMTAVNLEGIGICFPVQGVYPGSPAALAGIKRGTVISLINGGKITANNIEDYYYRLIMPAEASTLKLTEMNGTEATVTSKAMYINPVIKTQVDEINGYKIGYLVYSGFDASFDEELFDAFKSFKNQHITDLILDLRYNGGGHTISANLIASCIAGSTSSDKVFSQYRYNDERMRKLNNKRDEEYFAYSNYANLSTSLAAGGLNLPRVYCLTTGSTASASELVINALRGIDVEVVLIGESTRGKNVGMEYEDLLIDKVTYRVVPISFQSYNAKGFGDYENGFAPNLLIDENNPKNDSNAFYNYREYGSKEEPLYAAAIKMITGKDIQGTRSAGSTMKGNTYSLPEIYRPGHGGMLKKHAE